MPSEQGNTGFNVARWMIFSILTATYILVYFHRMAPAVAADFLMADFRITGAELGSLSGIYFFVYAAMQIPSGVIADTLGTRTAVVSGNVMAGTGSLIFALAPGFELAYFGRFLVGLGVSVIFVSIMKNNAAWFHEKVFAAMSGVTVLFGNLGSVLAAAPLAVLLDTYAWRTVFLGIGGLSFLLGLLGFLFVRNRPEDLGFAAPGRFASAAKPRISTNWMRNLASVLKTPRIWPSFWLQFGMTGTLYAFMGLWGVPYLKDVHGLSRTDAADYMTLMIVSFALGSFFFGWLSDRMGRRKPLIVLSLGTFIAVWLYFMYGTWGPGKMGFLIFGALGFLGSGFIITFAAAKEVCHPDLSGMAVSIVNCGCFIGTTVLQPLVGYLADSTWQGTMAEGIRVYSAQDYRGGFLAMLAFLVLALIASLLITETNCRNISTESKQD